MNNFNLTVLVVRHSVVLCLLSCEHSKNIINKSAIMLKPTKQTFYFDYKLKVKLLFNNNTSLTGISDELK